MISISNNKQDKTTGTDLKTDYYNHGLSITAIQQHAYYLQRARAQKQTQTHKTPTQIQIQTQTQKHTIAVYATYNIYA